MVFRKLSEFFNLTKWNGTCLEWQGLLNSDGYGRFYDGKKSTTAHRYIWRTFKNMDLKDNIYICHLCDNRLCVNIEHLYEGTAKTNGEDRSNRRLFCKRGHLILGHNLLITKRRNTTGQKTDHRRCRICDTEMRRKRKGAKSFGKKSRDQLQGASV